LPREQRTPELHGGSLAGIRCFLMCTRRAQQSTPLHLPFFAEARVVAVGTRAFFSTLNLPRLTGSSFSCNFSAGFMPQSVGSMFVLLFLRIAIHIIRHTTYRTSNVRSVDSQQVVRALPLEAMMLPTWVQSNFCVPIAHSGASALFALLCLLCTLICFPVRSPAPPVGARGALVTSSLVPTCI